MRFSVRTKIFCAMGAALVLALILGVVAILGVRHTFGLVQSIYRSNLLAIVAVGEAQHAIVDERIALNRAIVDPSTTSTLERINADEAKEKEAWARYYPANLSDSNEKVLADRYIALRASAIPLVDEESRLLDAGKTDEARKLHIAKASGALHDASAQIDKLMEENVRQASVAEVGAENNYHVTRNVAVAVLVVAVVVLLMIAVLITRAIVRPLMQARSLAQAIENGRLGHDTVVTGNDEFADTLRALDAMDRRLASIVSDVRDISEQVSSAAADISQGNDDLSQRTQEQASSLEETAASMEEMAAAVKQNADGASKARERSREVRAGAEQGALISTEATQAMGEITAASRQIGEIVTLIDEIAFQTNLLALNAAVEAARAGDQGRGFAVVATEVRNLAQRSGSAAREIKALISSATDKVEVGSKLVVRTGESLQKIAMGVREVSTIVEEIAAASQEQSAGVDQVNHAVLTLDEVTQQNAALVEEASAASKNAADLARELLRKVSVFTINGVSAKVVAPMSVATASLAMGTVSSVRTPLRHESVAAADGGAGVWQEF